MRTSPFVLGLLCASVIAASAQRPRAAINDASSNTILLGERQGGYTNQGGSACSAEPGEPPVAGSPALDTVWYKYTAPGTGRFVVTIPDKPGLRAELRRPGNPELTLPLQTVADGTSNTVLLEERLEVDLDRGETAYLVVDHGEPFDFTWRFAEVANDDYRDAHLVEADGNTLRQLTLGASRSADETALGCARPVVWYQWVAPVTKVYAADLVGSRAAGSQDYSGFRLRVYANGTGNVPGQLLTEGVGSALDNSTVCVFGATAGQRYWFAGGSDSSLANHLLWFSLYDPASPGAFAWANAEGYVQEGRDGSVRIIRLRGAANASTVKVSSSGITATPGVDYASGAKDVAFEAATRSKVTQITTFADQADEGAETLSLTLSSALDTEGDPLLLRIGDDTPTGTAAWSQPVVRVREGEMARIELRRTSTARELIGLSYFTQPGEGATGGADYSPTSGVAYINADEAYATVLIPTRDDDEFEAEEEFLVSVRLPAEAGIFAGEYSDVRVVIEDDDHFIAQAGKYTGLVDVDGWGALVSYSTTNAGTATGTVFYKGKRHAFQGAFDGRGRLYANMARAGQLPLHLQLAHGEGWQQCACSVRDARPAFGDGRVQTAFGDGSVRTIVGDGSVRLIPYDGRRRIAPQAGRYTVVTAGTPEAPVPAVLTGTVFGDGSVRFIGRMADGTPVSTGSSLTSIDAATGSGSLAPVSLALYGGKGSVYGYFDLGAGPQFPGTSTAGSWQKPWRAADVYYPALPFIEFTATCRRYVPPATGDRLLPALEESEGSARLNFAGGGTVADGTSNTVIISERNVATFPTNPNACALKFDAATGRYTGTIKPPGQAAPLPFYGVADQSTGSGGGFYLGNRKAGTVQLLPGI